jgi:hypothetical protein
VPNESFNNPAAVVPAFSQFVTTSAGLLSLGKVMPSSADDSFGMPRPVLTFSPFGEPSL